MVGPRRDRPLAGQSGSTSAAFAFATESPQHAQPPPPPPPSSNGPNQTPAVPNQSYRSPSTAKPTINEGDGGILVTAVAVQNELDQLESEVIHYMNVSMEEKEKSEALTGRLESVTQEKKDLERQVDDLDEQLSRDVYMWFDQEDGAPATEAGNTISRVSEKIAKLRTSAQDLEQNLKTLEMTSDRRADTITELQEQLHNKKQQLVQKTKEEDRLRKEMALMEETLMSEKKNCETLLSSKRKLEQHCNGLHAWKDETSKKLSESEETKETFRQLLDQRDTELNKIEEEKAAQVKSLQQQLANKQLLANKQSEVESALTTRNGILTHNNTLLEGNIRALKEKIRALEEEIVSLKKVRKGEAAQAQNLQNLLERRQKEVDSLNVSQSNLLARCKQAEAVALQYSQTIPQLQAQLASRPEPAAQQHELLGRIEALTKALARNQQRRMRAVGIGIDLSGSSAGSLEDGIKRVYAHLLDTLEHSPCPTYIMTVIHGPGRGVTVASNFGDDRAVHKRVMEGKQAGGQEDYLECLRRINDAAAATRLVLDLQVVMIGDCNTHQKASYAGVQEVCSQFLSSNPPVRVHSISVKTGAAEVWQKNMGGLEAWLPWNFVGATGGNMVLWHQNNELPDLSDLVH
ncbi:hypothetical protein DHEL01_v203672 [Diaporthe helianthi]|uniref:Uncharacterized protein n=1 Tax=Diaporthe helianthi TaxID=158607 RepID=A0A2P5I608_DIAHE|nr:hypothetical protein DHEL01_v203672 [Diaporthe helianthi]